MYHNHGPLINPIFEVNKIKQEIKFVFYRLPFNETVSALGSVRPRIYALIVCQSSFGEAGYELRQAIRQSWASGTKPIKLICCKPIKARSDNAANLWQMHMHYE